MQLKWSRCAEDEECSAYAVLRNRVKPAKHSKRELRTSIGEDMQAVSRDAEAWNQNSSGIRECSARNVVLDLNYHESAASVDAHAKKCKLRTEAESARAETVAQRTSFAEMRRISELEELMTCSCQSSSKLDQAKHISSSLQVESGRETGRSIFEQGGRAFLAFSTPDHNFKKAREMINNLITRLEEEEASDAEHKVWCDTKLATYIQTRKEKTAPGPPRQD